MNCPHCGADTKNAVTICPLCGKTLDRDDAYASYLKKGDDFSDAGDLEKAILSYRKALEYNTGDEDTFIKLGNAYNKKGDKQAASMYMKALSFNFYNDKTHNMLIALYSRYGRLDDLKNWYSQNRGRIDEVFIDKYVKIIENVKYFSAKPDIKIPATKTDNFVDGVISSMKRYMLLNIVGGIAVFVLGLAVVAGVVFKIDKTVIIAFSGLVFFAGVATIIFSRSRMKKKNDAGRESLEDIMAEVKGVRGKGLGVGEDETKQF